MRSPEILAHLINNKFLNNNESEFDVTTDEAESLENQWEVFISFLSENLKHSIVLIHGDVLNENRHYLLLTYEKRCNHF